MLRLGAVFVLALIVPVEARAQVVPLPAPGTQADRAPLTDAPDLDALPVTVSPGGVSLPSNTPRTAVRLRTESEDVNVLLVAEADMTARGRTLHVVRSSPLCQGACTLSLAIGHAYTLQIAQTGQRAAPRPASVTITAETVALDVRSEPVRKMRRRQWLTVGAMPVVGALLMGLGAQRGDAWCERHSDSGACDGPTRNAPLFYTGVGLALLFPCVLVVPLTVPRQTVITVIASDD